MQAQCEIRALRYAGDDDLRRTYHALQGLIETVSDTDGVSDVLTILQGQVHEALADRDACRAGGGCPHDGG